METLVKRLIACIIDVLIVYLPSLLIQPLFNNAIIDMKMPGFIFNWLNSSFISFFLFIIYTGFAEGIFSKTVGKMLMKVEVESNKEDQEVSLLQSFVRALIKSCEIYMFFSILAVGEVIYMLYNPESSVHDQIVGTYVCQITLG